jgi:hypothetical protein
LIFHGNREEYLILVIFQFFHGFPYFLLRSGMVTLEKGLPDQLAVTTFGIVMIFGGFIQIPDRVVAIHKNDGIGEGIQNMGQHFFSFHEDTPSLLQCRFIP